ncbi:hypothetical protein [Terribacillus saccharophilus]|uniref:DUF3290 domain-containing protein n=1 Tax=Terribacillus saccharophilus TaxID=361277 RepID=A0ABX4GW40_9BACI|nr:hypothetical protein [Terribacillus saccharophilus]PAD34763.1 hypothetical protein CHH56_13330 [Terribacillus saccharophilus]PAD95511.1 hypothetical protein CHH50_13565 [Terribacillus saccharophilus]PAD99089.1 hypothetical protein CHH48_14460 [Terribacillus saccharophilus]
MFVFGGLAAATVMVLGLYFMSKNVRFQKYARLLQIIGIVILIVSFLGAKEWSDHQRNVRDKKLSTFEEVVDTDDFSVMNIEEKTTIFVVKERDESETKYTVEFNGAGDKIEAMTEEPISE